MFILFEQKLYILKLPSPSPSLNLQGIQLDPFQTENLQLLL